jgi:hypothetical protein
MWPFRPSTIKVSNKNHWTGGTVNLAFPPLVPEDIGAHGARFLEAEFQRGRGTEIFLCIFEEAPWVQQYGSITELTTFTTTLAVNTETGPVAIILWRLGYGTETLVHYEHYLDPLHEPTQRLLARIENQSRLKIVMRNNRSGETDGFWEFDNTFAMAEFARRVHDACRGMRAGPFDQRVELVRRQYRVEDLIRISQG